MKLLLDEHLSPTVAQSLRDQGHDVVAVAERDDLRGAGDQEILLAAAAEGRVTVTMDVEDFAGLSARRLLSRQWHAGIIFASTHTFPGTRDGSGVLIRALEALLAARAEDDPLTASVIWLSRAPEDRPRP